MAVHIDGKRAFDLSASLAAEAGVRKDEFLSVERQCALLKADEPNRARELALAALARREQCEREIVDMLAAKGISAAVAEETGRWLREQGYVDDRRFAVAYARDRLRSGWGKRRIVDELARRGVAREVVSDEGWRELLEAADVEAEPEQLVQLVKRRFSRVLRDDPQTAKRRISGFLVRRGHDWDAIGRILRRVMDEVDHPEGFS